MRKLFTHTLKWKVSSFLPSRWGNVHNIKYSVLISLRQTEKSVNVTQNSNNILYDRIIYTKKITTNITCQCEVFTAKENILWGEYTKLP